MKCLDVLFFQAELTPEKLAIVAHGHVISYGRLAHGIVSAQRRLAGAGVGQGQTIGLSIAHPIDHLILICALYRLRAASASINTALDAYLDQVRFDAVLADSLNPVVSEKQPTAKLYPVDTSWFTDKVTFSVAERTSATRDPDPDWVCRVTCFPDDPRQPPTMTTSRAFEAQIANACLAAPPDWERVLSVMGLHTLAGLVQTLSALWLGRTLCIADAGIARNLIVAYKHHYLVASAQEIERMLTEQANEFMAMPVLRAVHVAGQRFSPALVTRCLETISSNTVLGYTHPMLGLLAYGAAARIKDTAGAVGFVAPWAEVQVIGDGSGDDRPPLGVEREGELRFRDRGDQTGKPGSAAWIYPGQRARLTATNLLIVH
jgi:acyl-CoA synthetase (AMP-forming)/AMP-acid ligase II